METTAILADREGQVVDSQFRLGRWLGGSAEGSVYLTQCAGASGGRAAIKLIPAGSPGAEARLGGWAAAARFDHPHVLRVFQSGRTRLEDQPDGEEVIYVVTEYADEVLAEILPDRALTPDEVKEMLGPLLDALAGLHGHGFVHGRIKPSNILVVNDSLKLSAECAPIATAKAAALALPASAYDAPELCRGVVSPAVDIWSLGMLMVAALTQRTPAWDRESGFEPVVRPALPAPFEATVRDCLRLDPASRLTLPEIKDRLEGKTPAEGTPPDLEPDFTPTPAHTTRWAPAWIAAAVFLGIAVTAFILHGRQSPLSAADQTAVADQTTAPAPEPPATAPAAAAPSPDRSQAAPPHSTVMEKPSAVRPAPPSRPQPSGPETAGGAPGSANGAILKRVMPSALPSALATIRGRVLINVRVQVDAGGAVSDAVSESPGASRYFNRISIEAAQAWQFAPAAPSVWELHFVFHPGGASVTANERNP